MQPLGDSQFSLVSTPAAATQATATLPAAAAVVRHVLKSLTATLACGATAQATPAVLVVRDGASGAGTILWAQQVILPVNGVWSIAITDLSLLGSRGTAMTVEFTGAGVAGSVQSISATGYDVE